MQQSNMNSQNGRDENNTITIYITHVDVLRNSSQKVQQEAKFHGNSAK